ncbi:glycoside hydrolase family 61 protein [Xylariaceae sp. FL0804]|nr:glycoside hydrolase family 61 protein [Xylariaceae sp. FL0804]
MKSFIAAALFGAAQAHYTFPGFIYDGTTEADWTYVRETANYESHGPVQDVTSIDMRCYQLANGSEGAKTMSVMPGDTIGWTVDPDIEHPGPLQVYMAPAPAGTSAADFDGSGDVWFKIYEDGPTFGTDVNGLEWKDTGNTTVNVQIPTCVAAGDYLVRVEHIALHSASSVGGAQFYLACSQVTVGGSGTQTFPGVAFPGAYSATDPGILIDLYYPIPTNYTNPGPAPITC